MLLGRGSHRDATQKELKGKAIEEAIADKENRDATQKELKVILRNSSSILENSDATQKELKGYNKD